MSCRRVLALGRCGSRSLAHTAERRALPPLLAPPINDGIKFILAEYADEVGVAGAGRDPPEAVPGQTWSRLSRAQSVREKESCQCDA